MTPDLLDYDTAVSVYDTMYDTAVPGYICCTQEHDGDDPFYIREFHISMRHYVY